MLRISADSRPPYAIELIAKGISLFAGSFPLAGANKGKNSEDPSVEQQFLSDPQTYRRCFHFFFFSVEERFNFFWFLSFGDTLVDGKLRVATGLAILTVSLSPSLFELFANLEPVHLPVRPSQISVQDSQN